MQGNHFAAKVFSEQGGILQWADGSLEVREGTFADESAVTVNLEDSTLVPDFVTPLTNLLRIDFQDNEKPVTVRLVATDANTETVVLVSEDGSWRTLSLPEYDSGEFEFQLDGPGLVLVGDVISCDCFSGADLDTIRTGFGDATQALYRGGRSQKYVRAHNTEEVVVVHTSNNFCSVGCSSEEVDSGNCSTIPISSSGSSSDRFGFRGCEALLEANHQFENGFVVGGSITGHSGAISIRSSEFLYATASASDDQFEFQVPFADGSSVEIFVASSQPQDSCRTTRRTATVNVADVRTLAVECVPRDQPVGGILQDLRAGTVLSLELVGHEVLPLTANGVYQFATTLPINSSYTVRVDHEPAGQICSISNKTGNVQGPVSDVNISCADRCSVLAGSANCDSADGCYDDAGACTSCDQRTTQTECTSVSCTWLSDRCGGCDELGDETMCDWVLTAEQCSWDGAYCQLACEKVNPGPDCQFNERCEMVAGACVSKCEALSQTDCENASYCEFGMGSCRAN